jgi:hypothetical protein
MSNAESSTTPEDDASPPSSRDFTKTELDVNTFFHGSIQPSHKMKVTIDRDWDPYADLGDFPTNVERIVWAWRDETTKEQFIGLVLTNGTYVYIHVVEAEEDYLIVPVIDEDSLDFFKPREMRAREPSFFEDDDGMFDLADEV